MVGARVLALAFGAVGSVWAARCLGPHNLGLSGMVLSVVTQGALVLGFVHPTILIREYKNSQDSIDRNGLIRVAATYYFLCSVFLAFVGCGLLGLRLLPHDYHFAGWFFVPLIILTSIQPIWLFQAAEKQHFQSIIAVLQPFLMAILYLTFFRPGMSAGADLAVISCVTLVLTVIYWYAVYRLTPFKGIPFSWGDLMAAWPLVRKSMWFFISGLAVYIYTVLEQPLLGWLYSIEELGKYRTAFTIVNAAASIFGITVTIFFPRFLEWRKRGEEVLWRRQKKLGLLFAGLGCVGIVAAFILMPHVHPLLFGAKFADAAVPAAILIASKLVVVVSGVFVWGLRTDHLYDKRISLYIICVAVFSLISNLLFIPKFGMYAASLTNLASEIIILVVFVRMATNRIRILRKEIAWNGNVI